MMWPQNQAGSRAAQEIFERLDFGLRRFFFGDHMVEAEDHKRIRIGQNAFVQR